MTEDLGGGTVYLCCQSYALLWRLRVIVLHANTEVVLIAKFVWCEGLFPAVLSAPWRTSAARWSCCRSVLLEPALR